MHENLGMKFTNRTAEFIELNQLTQKTGMLVIFGRRRVGKTRLITQWLKKNEGLYTQAIEGDPHLQLKQIFDDIQPYLSTSITPKTWKEFFEVLEIQKKPLVFCIDEFPYLVASDRSLPSIFQKWLDHGNRKQISIILIGSSTNMMNDLFLNRSAPLFGRATKILHIEPMGYPEFCSALEHPQGSQDSFSKFSLVGGIPKYWEFIEAKMNAIESAENLYFGFAPYMENEPKRILSDENISGLNSISILEVVGRGAHKPSEIAQRLETAQTNLSRYLQQLSDASILIREIPFGESLRNSKKSLYQIKDPAIRFWYSTFSPHRVLWQTYDTSKKAHLLNLHASAVFENHCRQLFLNASRYWEKEIEFDMVRTPHDPANSENDIIISEVKFKKLLKKDRTDILARLKFRWNQTQLSKKYTHPKFEVLDLEILSSMQAIESTLGDL